MNVSKPSVRIRTARHADLDALVELENRSFDTDRVSRTQYRRHLDSATGIVLIADTGEKIAGSALVFLRSHSSRARLYSIAIAHDCRGMGVGAALLLACEKAARDGGRQTLYLEVRGDNTAAIKLYESRGYRRGPTLHRFYEDGADARRYEKAIG
ncbi:MAG TPA: GNAT family N-acetyltransferase [Rudaea sp.]|jgi:ribosomal protein S18 acetylase RimI-like enzyme|nr:GNAT family N-acetyltransferase [Rudaea sp.]